MLLWERSGASQQAREDRGPSRRVLGEERRWDVSILTQFFLLLQELVENTTGWIPEIIPTPRGPCLESSGGKVEPEDQTPAGFRAAPMVLSVSSAATPSRLPLAAFLLGQGTLSWLLATLQAGV